MNTQRELREENGAKNLGIILEGIRGLNPNIHRQLVQNAVKRIREGRSVASIPSQEVFLLEEQLLKAQE